MPVIVSVKRLYPAIQLTHQFLVGFSVQAEVSHSKATIPVHKNRLQSFHKVESLSCVSVLGLAEGLSGIAYFKMVSKIYITWFCVSLIIAWSSGSCASWFQRRSSGCCQGRSRGSHGGNVLASHHLPPSV